MARRAINIRSKRALPKGNFLLNITNRDKAKLDLDLCGCVLDNAANQLTDDVGNNLIF